MPDFDQELFDKACDDFADCQEYYGELYDNADSDREFVFGINQWDEAQASARKKQLRPCLTFNLCLPYANQVINDYRQSRPSIRVTPVDDEGDQETAEVIQGLIRATERQSKATIAYDTAFAHGVYGGLGWLRVGTRYVSDNSFNQEPYIMRILNPTSVYIDPDAQSLDGSDAGYAFAFEEISKEEYEEKYPDFPVSSFDNVRKRGWTSQKNVTIAEYFYTITDFEKLYRVDISQEGVTVEKSITQEQKDILDDKGDFSYEIIETRDVEVKSIKHCRLSGGGILEENDWAGDYIPLVPVFGIETFLDGKQGFQSLVRQAKDGQRAYNYWNTASTEVIALQQKAPFIAPVGSFKSYPKEWENANNENFAYLEYDVVQDENAQILPPPQRQPPIMGSPAMMQAALGAREDLRLSLGMPQANMGEQGNEISGVAIRNRQVEGDNATFHFSANMAVSMSRVGVILLDLYRKLYDGKRIIRILGQDGKEEKNIPIGQPYVKEDKEYRLPKKGEQAHGIFDFNVGKYDVVMDVGASYSSKRQETADKLTELISARPELLNIAGDILFDVLDVPRGDDIADRLRAQMPPELLGDDLEAQRLKQAAEAIQKMQEQLSNYEAALSDKKKNEEFEQFVKTQKIDIDRKELNIKAQKTAAEIEKMRAEVTGYNMDAMAAVSKSMVDMSAQVQDMGIALEHILNAKEREELEATSEPVQSVEMSGDTI